MLHRREQRTKWVLPTRVKLEKGMPYVTSLERYSMKKGRIEGRHEAIESVLQVRFPNSGTTLMPQVRKVEDLDKLHGLLETAMTATLLDIQAAIESAGPASK